MRAVVEAFTEPASVLLLASPAGGFPSPPSSPGTRVQTPAAKTTERGAAVQEQIPEAGLAA